MQCKRRSAAQRRGQGPGRIAPFVQALAAEIGLMQAKKSAGIKIGAEDFQNPSNMDLIVGED